MNDAQKKMLSGLREQGLGVYQDCQGYGHISEYRKILL